MKIRWFLHKLKIKIILLPASAECSVQIYHSLQFLKFIVYAAQLRR